MKQIMTITFHHAHNFGSVLQAYALQESVKSLCPDADYRIINFYTETQEELYRVYKSGKSVKSVVKNLIALPYAKSLKAKHQKFEDFLAQRCNLTERYKTEEELIEKCPKADIYISGSDQIWNVRAKDFSEVYYLGFVKEGKKISYAASFGPMKIDWKQYDADKYKALLREYEAVSVREPGSAENIQWLTGKSSRIHADPTLLLSADQWREIQSDANYKDGQYILLYCLEPSKKQLEMAKAVSEKLNLPIVVLKYNNKNDMFNPFVKKYDAGPEDFLAYLDHAALVLSSSFHGTVFSLIYHKPFYVLNGLEDNRICSILRKTDMTHRSLETIEDMERVTLEVPDRQTVERALEAERSASREYLRSVL